MLRLLPHVLTNVEDKKNYALISSFFSSEGEKSA
jgi:hypothetical protein